jgi:hypothetical protein
MLNWWNSMLPAQQILALIAIPSTLILIIQTVMVLIGFGDSGDGGDVDADDVLDGDTDDGGLGLFSVRGIVSALCIMGWSGVALLETSLPMALSLVIAVLSGVLTLFAIALLMKAIYRLQSSGNIDYGNAIGKVGQVYIPIPAGGMACGKVSITVQEKLTECDAITVGDTVLATGSYVRVIAVGEGGVLVVEPVTRA